MIDGLEHYIQLKTRIKLEKLHIEQWWKVVNKYSPENTVTSFFMKGPEKGESVKLIRRQNNSDFYYIIPTSRHLLTRELEKIVDAFEKEFDFCNFIIEGSGEEPNLTKVNINKPIDYSDDSYYNLCVKLAKALHNKWYSEKTNTGWKFGLSFSKKNKTHPMLRPWDELPEDYKKVDYDLPNILMHILKEEGYTIVEEKRLFNLLKNKK